MTAPLILYVEDDRIDILIWEHFLQRQPVSMVPVMSVKEAVTQFDDSYIGAIIDWNLFDGEGVEVAEFIRSKCPDLPIIFVSTHLTPEIKQAAQRVNALGCFEKTSDPDYTQRVYDLVCG